MVRLLCFIPEVFLLMESFTISRRGRNSFVNVQVKYTKGDLEGWRGGYIRYAILLCILVSVGSDIFGRLLDYPA